MEGTKIGFVGAGNMAQAVVKGLLSSGKPFNISASATKETSESYQKMKSLGVSMHVNNVEICQSHVVVIAVKPYLVAKVMGEIKDHLTSDHVIVSLAAGVSVADLSQCAPSDVGVVRTSITTTVCVQSGVVVMVASPNVSDEHKKLLTDIFSVLGHFEMTDKEEYVKINTTFPGSGVAYMCMLLEAYSDGGVLIGLPRAKAIQIAAMTMMGTAKMVLETGKHPGECAPTNVGVVRTIISTTVSVQSGVVIMAHSPNTANKHKKLLRDIFSVLGHFEMSDNEEYVSNFSGYPGCGVAYMCMLLEAYSDGGMLIGLPRTKALQIAAKTMIGTAKMVLETGKHPAELKDEVCSPKGTTILGVQSLERSGFRSSIIDAIDTVKRGRRS